MKLWIDDLRPAPAGYTWVKTVNDAKWYIESAEEIEELFPTGTPIIKLIDLDHDAGDYRAVGGDYINILNWLEYRQHSQNGKVYPIRIHSFNPVGCVNMRAIIERNGWKEIR
jgi:hypothetical protein